MDGKDEVREQIVEAARQVFHRYGFKKTTMDDIALSINKGKSSLYYYFPGKEQVFQAVVEKEATMLRAQLAESVSKVNEPDEKLRLYIEIRMTKLAQMFNFYDAIKNELLSHLEFIDKIRKKYDEHEIETVAQILQEGIDKQVFVVEDAKIAAIAIVTAMKGLEVPLLWADGATEIQHRVASVISILFYGIIKR